MLFRYLFGFRSLLQELAKESPTSWLEGFWNTMYLGWRDPVVIHINPCFVFEDDPTPLRFFSSIGLS